MSPSLLAAEQNKSTSVSAPPRAGSAVAPAVTKACSSVWPFTQAMRKGEQQEDSWYHSSSQSSAIPGSLKDRWRSWSLERDVGCGCCQSFC